MTITLWLTVAVMVVLAFIEVSSRLRFTRHTPEQVNETGVYWILLIGANTIISKMRAVYDIPFPDGSKQRVISHNINLTHKYKQESYDV